MDDLFREYTSGNGYLFRVNARKGTYLVFKDRIPIDNPSLKTKTVVFGMHYVAFLGSRFEMVLDVANSIHFLGSSERQVSIPFRFLGVSDVRHLRLPVYLPTDHAPVVVYHFKDYQVNMLRRYFNGMQFFVVDSYMPQSDIVKIKNRFPMARVVVFREDQEKVKLGQSENLNESASIRATDLMMRESRSLNQEGALFVARLYLRRMEWSKMWTLPLEVVLLTQDITYILSFLSSMLLKVFRDKELQKHQERLRELELLFVSLRPFLMFRKRRLSEFIKKAKVPIVMADYLKSVLKKQILLRDSNRHSRQIAFLEKALDQFDQVQKVDIEL